MQYLVIWAMDIDAISPVEAAKAARRYRERDGTSANVYEIYTKDRDPVTTIDLSERGKGRDTGPSPNLLSDKGKVINKELLDVAVSFVNGVDSCVEIAPDAPQKQVYASIQKSPAYVKAKAAIETAKNINVI